MLESVGVFFDRHSGDTVCSRNLYQKNEQRWEYFLKCFERNKNLE